MDLIGSGFGEPSSFITKHSEESITGPINEPVPRVHYLTVVCFSVESVNYAIKTCVKLAQSSFIYCNIRKSMIKLMTMHCVFIDAHLLTAMQERRMNLKLPYIFRFDKKINPIYPVVFILLLLLLHEDGNLFSFSI